MAFVVLRSAASGRSSVIPVALHVHRLVLIRGTVVQLSTAITGGGGAAAHSPAIQQWLLQMRQLVATLPNALLYVVRNLLGRPLQPTVTHGTGLALC